MLVAATRAAARAAVSSLTITLGLAAQSRAPQAPPCDIFCHSRLANQAAAAGNFATYRAQVQAVAALAPSHPGVAYAMARAFVRTGSPDSALAWLARLGRMGDTRDPDVDSAFAPLRTRPEYVAARARLLSNRLPIVDGKVAFEIADPDFIPEALAWDAGRSRFLVGSLAHRKLSAMTPDGTESPFIEPTPEILRVVGIHIDAPRNRLWFATWAPDSMRRGDSTDVPSVTRLFLADLASGHIVRSWVPDGGRPGHLLNDFVVMSDGTLFITDTERGSLYRLRSPSDTLELFVQPDPARYSAANGITATPDGRTLYVAFVEGIARLDLASRGIALLPAPDSASTASVDGLYWHHGSLIGVQGVPTLERVVRYELSEDGRRVTAASVLERGLPEVRRPTTGTLVGSRFYYIANSQYDRLGDAGGPMQRPAGAPVRTAVRVVDLRW